jgi:hypothetical protein
MPELEEAFQDNAPPPPRFSSALKNSSTPRGIRYNTWFSSTCWRSTTTPPPMTLMMMTSLVALVLAREVGVWASTLRHPPYSPGCASTASLVTQMLRAICCHRSLIRVVAPLGRTHQQRHQAVPSGVLDHRSLLTCGP